MRDVSRVAVAVLALAVSLAACSSGSTPSSAPTRAPSTRTSASSAAGATPSTAEPTLWLCRPGMPKNPCEGDLDTTVVAPDGSRSRQPFRPARDPRIDCFYAYPTVSSAPTANAPLASAPELVSTARAQAALFASVCRLYVPVYRQLTTASLLSGGFFDPKARATALQSLTAAWHDYLAHDNRGRGVVLIGHSQGAMMLTRLIASEVDRDPAVRRLLVSALLLGGQVTTAAGKDTGGDFTQVPACRRPGQTGCVIGYSSFSAEPVANAYFGHAPAGKQVLCTAPSALAGGSGLLHPYLPADRVGGGAGFVAYPGSLTGGCHHTATATWLQIARRPGSRIPQQGEVLGPQWGLHIGDVNLALGDLISDVRLQAAAWR